MRGESLRRFFRTSKTLKRLHLTNFNPCRHKLDFIADLVGQAINAGTDGLLLGGTKGDHRHMLEAFGRTVHHALEASRKKRGGRPPLILFPSKAGTGVSAHAEGVLFLSLLNRKDVHYLMREQARAASRIRTSGLEPVGCGMIWVAPEGAPSDESGLIAREDIDEAAGYAVAAESFGFPVVYLNAGSGAKRPVPPEMIEAVSNAIDAPLVVGGGLITPEQVAAAARCGADIVVTGTAIERSSDVYATVKQLADAVHSVPPSNFRKRLGRRYAP